MHNSCKDAVQTQHVGVDAGTSICLNNLIRLKAPIQAHLTTAQAESSPPMSAALIGDATVIAPLKTALSLLFVPLLSASAPSFTVQIMPVRALLEFCCKQPAKLSGQFEACLVPSRIEGAPGIAVWHEVDCAITNLCATNVHARVPGLFSAHDLTYFLSFHRGELTRQGRCSMMISYRPKACHLNTDKLDWS